MTGEPESLDTAEPLAARLRRHDYDRLIMLSDGVFAIAITLLAFDIRPPAGWDGQFASFWATLRPLFSAYLLSFLVISVYWLMHRRFMARLARVDAVATVLNLVMLGLVALLPAATRLAEATDGPTPALGLYAALVIAIGVSIALFWGYAGLIGGLALSEVGPRDRWIGFLGALLSPPAFLALTIETRIPPRLVPVALLLLFIGGSMALSRLTREPQRAPDQPTSNL
ncbi:MAG TPA: TMEM175 family protein [Caulobacteraceae bacterium]|jgi:uncharacterized membrane protein|nr:TMEM175 family protein [Caulobacteraceae bacterium]